MNRRPVSTGTAVDGLTDGARSTPQSQDVLAQMPPARVVEFRPFDRTASNLLNLLADDIDGAAASAADRRGLA